jgi:hypothetical protein
MTAGKITDASLLSKINEAVAASNEAEMNVTTAQAELVSRSRAVGVLLLEAKKLHPAVKDFEAFLKRVDGLKRSRAYDLLRLAGGRVTDEELKEDARQRKQKSRDRKKKLPLPEPKKPEPISVTDPDVTETAKAGAELPKAEKHEAKTAAMLSSVALAEFTFACRTYLPRMTPADRHKALQLVTDLVNPKAEAA